MHKSGRLLLVLALVVGAHLWIPRPVVACSCVEPAVVVESAGRDPGASVFTATAGPRVGNQIPVVITSWLKGVPPVGPAVIEGEDPLSMCGSTSPPAGGHYLFVTYRSETSGLAISGCSVQADVSTPEGQALLARAIETYGAGVAPPTDAAPESTAPPDAYGDPTVIGAIASVAASVAPLALVIAFALGLLGGVALILRRRPRLDD